MKFLIFFVCLTLLAFSDHFSFLKSYLKDIPHEPGYKSGFEKVDCIYVINLDKHQGRWSRIQEQLSKHGLNAIRVSAVNGWDFNKQELKNLYHGLLTSSYQKFSIAPGILGCFLSHMSILKDALEKKYQVIWVLEDDCELENNPVEVLSNILKETSLKKINWDALYTDTGSRYLHPDGTLERYDFDKMCSRLIGKCSYLPKKEQSSLEEAEWIQRRLGMYSVLLSNIGIKKIWQHFMTDKLQWAYDVDINFIKDKRFLQTKEDVVSTSGAFGSSTSKK